MKLLYLLFVIGLCGCRRHDVSYSAEFDDIDCQWSSAYSNVTITAVRDGKVIQIGSPRSDVESPRNVRVGFGVTNIVIGSDFVGTFQLGAKFYPLQTLP